MSTIWEFELKPPESNSKRKVRNKVQVPNVTLAHGGGGKAMRDITVLSKMEPV